MEWRPFTGALQYELQLRTLAPKRHQICVMSAAEAELPTPKPRIKHHLRLLIQDIHLRRQ
jgi:hypothetical protein